MTMQVLRKTIIKSALLITQVIALLTSVIVFCFSFYNTYTYTVVYFDEIQQVFFVSIIVPFMLMSVISYMIVKSLKEDALFPKITKYKMINLILFSIYQIVCLLISCYIAIVAYNIFFEKPPQLFPINSAQATYTIAILDHQDTLKKQKLYYLTYDTISKGKDQPCRNMYKNNGETHCYHEVMIGKSKRDLRPFLNREIIIDGNFVYGNKQCIARKCTDIGSYIVFNIDEIRLK